MDAVVSITGAVALLLLLGLAAGITGRGRINLRWLLLAGALVFVNDAALTGLYGLLPQLLPESDWNWQGKLLALAISLAIAAHPAFGWQRVGLTLVQDRKGLPMALVVSAALLILFAVPALLSDDGAAEPGRIAFQLTMPGLEEEPFYRGILLFALVQALPGRWRGLGIDWNWGALLTCVAFGLAHALSFEAGSFEADWFDFDPMTFALTGIPAILLVWLRERTGSLLLPILLHNYANSIGLFI